jgi:endonuclease/exonuclease/phosphatase (EEP) superfamily protein YafD
LLRPAPPWDGWLFELLRHFRLWCGVIGLGLACIALLLRQWKWAVLALLTGLWQGYPWISSRWQSPAANTQAAAITVVSCNLLYEASEPDRMVASLRKADADVLILLEFSPKWQAILKRDLWAQYPHRVERPMEGAFGICLASKRPLEDGMSMMDDAGFTCVRGIVTVEEQRVAVLGVHPLPPMWPSMYDQWRDSFRSWPGMLSHLKAGHQVLAGDLNSSQFSRTFRALCATAGLRDGAEGFALQNTWYAGRPPFGLPLDHVLVSSGLSVLEYEVGPEAGSDHRWVRAVLGITGK